MKPGVVSRCFLLLAALVLCAGDPAPAAAADNEILYPFDPREKVPKPDLRSVPRLRFLTTVDFPPFNFIDQSGKLSGFHVDLAREICTELGVIERCQIEAVPYADLVNRLDKGEGEVAIAGARITPDLRASHDFSRIYLRLPARFAARRADAGPQRLPADLGDKPVGVLTGSAHEAMARVFFPTLSLIGFADRPAMLAALRKGEIKSVFGDALQLSFWLESNDAGNCCDFLGGPYYSSHFLGEGMALMAAPGNPALVQALDHALIALARNGRLADLYLRYLPKGL
ncbi:polar amino acid transport system substrate-binding protein [Rhizobium sp. SG_E_25_P2]|uniref:transporter substrate-binding domain-containing protein n=1 Tax=Rhizobium sp. SG_E_25_P2 TaxID=2879942 RepID=UPI002473BF51|nr:transporter substrate-binding domain-containing protein [Rhizobium sp. SG_E_25_P2]MDH6265709.1 polar amino acid transport system substrate-binding protein [Rhizobium sp. SG_E_25_P2]